MERSESKEEKRWLPAPEESTTPRSCEPNPIPRNAVVRDGRPLHLPPRRPTRRARVRAPPAPLLPWVPHRLERRLRQQGIRGPPRSLLSGNATDYRALFATAQSAPLASFHHAVVARVAPHYREWPARYGRPFVFWFGPQPLVVVSGPEVVKAVLTDSTGTFDKASSGASGNPLARQLIGEGLVGLTGEKWAHHRRVIAPAFNMERIKHFCWHCIKGGKTRPVMKSFKRVASTSTQTWKI